LARAGHPDLVINSVTIRAEIRLHRVYHAWTIWSFIFNMPLQESGTMLTERVYQNAEHGLLDATAGAAQFLDEVVDAVLFAHVWNSSHGSKKDTDLPQSVQP